MRSGRDQILTLAKQTPRTKHTRRASRQHHYNNYYRLRVCIRSMMRSMLSTRDKMLPRCTTHISRYYANATRLWLGDKTTTTTTPRNHMPILDLTINRRRRVCDVCLVRGLFATIVLCHHQHHHSQHFNVALQCPHTKHTIYACNHYSA